MNLFIRNIIIQILGWKNNSSWSLLVSNKICKKNPENKRNKNMPTNVGLWFYFLVLAILCVNSSEAMKILMIAFSVFFKKILFCFLGVAFHAHVYNNGVDLFWSNLWFCCDALLWCWGWWRWCDALPCRRFVGIAKSDVFLFLLCDLRVMA